MKRSIIICSMMISGLLYGQEPLWQYLNIAAEKNPGLQSAFKEYMAAMEKVSQVGSLPDPKLAFGYFISPVETRLGPQQFKASLLQSFPWFGLLDAREDVATERARIKFEAFREEKSKLFYSVKSTYYNYYYIDKGILITKENLDILQIFRRLALVKFESGMVSAVDELRVEMEINDLENQLAWMEDVKATLQVQFNNLLDTVSTQPIIIPDTLPADEIPYAWQLMADSISAHNHLIQQIEHRMLAWEKQQKVAQKTGMPGFSIGLDYTSVGKSSYPLPDGSQDGKDALLLPKVSISLPLYRKKYNAMVKEAVLQMEAAGFDKRETVNRLNTLFEQLRKDFRDADRRVGLYRKQGMLAQKSLDLLLADYSTNGDNFEEVLRMERKVLKYKLELDKARADQNTALAFITYLMGN